MNQFKNMLYVTVGALFLATVVTSQEANASSLTISTTNNNSIEYQIAAMQFLPDSEDSEIGFGGKTTPGDYNRGETTKKGCSNGDSITKCSGSESVVRSYRAPNGQICYVCGANPAQKCLDEGYKKQEDWPKVNKSSSNDAKKPESLLASIFDNILGIKNANAAVMEAVKPESNITDTGGTHVIPGRDDEIILRPDPLDPLKPFDPVDPVRPVDPGVQVPLDKDWTFRLSATCPYDSSYVKGEWVLPVKTCNIVNCKTCASGSTTTCASCITGFTLSSGICIQKTVANCISYDSSRNCLSCASGYTLNGGACTQNPTPVSCTSLGSNYYDTSRPILAFDCTSSYESSIGKTCYHCIRKPVDDCQPIFVNGHWLECATK